MASQCITYINPPACAAKPQPVVTGGLMRGNGTLRAPLDIDFHRLTRGEAERLIELICCSSEAIKMLKQCLGVPEHDAGALNAIPPCGTIPKGSTYFATDCETLFMAVDCGNGRGCFWLDLSNSGGTFDGPQHSSGPVSAIPEASSVPPGSSYYATDCESLFARVADLNGVMWLDVTNVGA